MNSMYRNCKYGEEFIDPNNNSRLLYKLAIKVTLIKYNYTYLHQNWPSINYESLNCFSGLKKAIQELKHCKNMNSCLRHSLFFHFPSLNKKGWMRTFNQHGLPKRSLITFCNLSIRCNLKKIVNTQENKYKD